MSLRTASKKVFWTGVVLAVGLTGTLSEARAQKKASQTTSTPAPAKPPAVATKATTAPPQNAGKTGGPQKSSGTSGSGVASNPRPPYKPPPVYPHYDPTKTVRPPTPSRDPIPYQPRPGEQAKSLPGGGQEFHDSKTDRTVKTNARGEVHQIEAPRGLAGGKIVINRAPGGGRIVETGRPGARVVSFGPHRGFVERTVRPGYVSRTYVVSGRSFAHMYGVDPDFETTS
jgi:hypothetical protein